MPGLGGAPSSGADTTGEVGVPFTGAGMVEMSLDRVLARKDVVSYKINWLPWSYGRRRAEAVHSGWSEVVLLMQFGSPLNSPSGVCSIDKVFL